MLPMSSDGGFTMFTGDFINSPCMVEAVMTLRLAQFAEIRHA
jgi:hypothetical protein